MQELNRDYGQDGLRPGDIIEFDSYEDMVEGEAGLNRQGLICRRHFDCYSDEPGFCLKIVDAAEEEI